MIVKEALLDRKMIVNSCKNNVIVKEALRQRKLDGK